jgi:L-iditol 2-dehydrogenase
VAGPGDLVLRVRGCGLCGSDLARIRGPAPAPTVPGHEVVGEVLEVGPGGGPFRPGERVVVAHHVPCFGCHYCRRGSPSMCRTFKASHLDPGGFAERVRVPAENARHATFRVPPEMPDVVASFTEPLGCCVRAVRRADLRPGDLAAVVGLGAMGQLIAQLVRRTGAAAVAVDPLAARRELALALGAAAAVGPPEAPGVLSRLSDGRGADVAVLTVGSPAVVRDALGWVRDGGAVHLFVGEGEGPLPVEALYKRELTLTATYSSSPADLAEAFALLRAGAVRVAELCSHRLPLGEVGEAVRLMERREALKVYVEMAAGG